MELREKIWKKYGRRGNLMKRSTLNLSYNLSRPIILKHTFLYTFFDCLGRLLVKGVYCHSTSTSCFIALRFIVLHRCCVFCGNSVLNKSTGGVFQTAFAAPFVVSVTFWQCSQYFKLFIITILVIVTCDQCSLMLLL